MQKFESFRDFKTEEEQPLDPDAAGHFRTETFNQWVFDPVANIGMNIWFASGEGGGGQPFPNFLSTILIFIGKDKYTSISVGKGNHQDGVAAGNAFLTRIEPFKRWKIDFLGLLERTGSTDKPLLSRLDLIVDIKSPPIEQGTQGDRGEVGSSGAVPRIAIRYEQLCHITGSVQIGDRKIEVDALGVRSHRRNSASIYETGAVGHTWATAMFPSGRGFHLLSYQAAPNAEVNFLYGHYFDGERYFEATVTRFPYFSGINDAEKSALELQVGEKLLQVELETCPPFFTDIPPQGVRLTRSPARYMLDGEVGGGVLERSLMPQFAAGKNYQA